MTFGSIALGDPRVSIARLSSASYGARSGDHDAVSAALERAAAPLGWSEEGRGALGGAIRSGARVLIKPNWVTHENDGPWGVEPLVTHSSLIRAAVSFAIHAGAARITVGDAPLQLCDFGRLLAHDGLGSWAEALKASEPRFAGIMDFRRTTCTIEGGVRVAADNLQPLDRFVIVDLASQSLHEPVPPGGSNYRVTCYDPKLMAETHSPGRHQYLIAREVLDADVVINLPKLKTHKKAGVTGALKNLVGINGNKEFLPHHRVGGSDSGGDCYPGHSRVKTALEYVYDRQNSAASKGISRVWHQTARLLDHVLAIQGDVLGVEGAWSGNDTVWRTCLDLNRILHYGRVDGTLAESPQRRILHIVDAIVAGQGDGPLSPQALPLGLILAGNNAPAVDWVGAHLLGYEPDSIPLVHGAFERFRWPLAAFSQEMVSVCGDLGHGPAAEILGQSEFPSCRIPAGWQGALRVPVAHQRPA